MIVDWVQSISIVMVFGLLTMVQVFNSSIESVQENWALNRCTPSIIPFAGYLAPKGSNISTQDNFSYCIQNTMNSFVPMMTQPFNYLQSMTVDMMGSLNDSNEGSKEKTSSMSFSISGIINSIFGTFSGIIIEFNVLVVKLMDAQAKLSGIIATLMYIMTAVQYTFQSMWNGIPGAMIQVMGKK